MHRKSFGLWIAAGCAATSLFLGGCHNASDDAAAQKKAIEGRPMTPEEQKVMEQERANAIKGAQQGAGQSAQQGKPK